MKTVQVSPNLLGITNPQGSYSLTASQSWVGQAWISGNGVNSQGNTLNLNNLQPYVSGRYIIKS